MGSSSELGLAYLTGQAGGLAIGERRPADAPHGPQFIPPMLTKFLPNPFPLTSPACDIGMRQNIGLQALESSRGRGL